MGLRNGGSPADNEGGAHRGVPAKVRGGLPTAADLNAVPGAPGGFVQQQPDPAQWSPNPDPRGPCGSPMAQPIFDTKDFGLYMTSTTEVLVFSRRLAPGSAARFLDAVWADMQPGCRRFTSRTPYAHAQVNQLLTEIPIGDLGDQRAAFATRIRQDVRGSQWAFGSEAFVRRGDFLAAIVVVARTRPSDAFVRGVAAVAAAGLPA